MCLNLVFTNMTHYWMKSMVIQRNQQALLARYFHFGKWIALTVHHLFTSLASCQSKKHLHNSFFVLPLQQQFCTIKCCRHAAEKAITHSTRSSSYTMPLLNRIAHSMATLCDHSFSSASSSVWNSIPNDVRCAPSLSPFKSCLKTCLFRSVYIDLTFYLITVYMCMVWPCYSFVDGLS